MRHRHRRRHSHSSPLPSCFRPGPAIKTEVSPRISTHPNLTTSLYHTELGLFGLTWSRNLFGRSLHIHLHLNEFNNSSLSANPSFHLQIRPFTFWKKRGSKRLLVPNPSTSNECTSGEDTMAAADVYWDLSRAKFGSRPGPTSGFYVAIVIDGKMALLVGDSDKEAAYAIAVASTTARAAAAAAARNRVIPAPDPEKQQVMFLRREHVYGNNLMLYTTKADFGGGREREVSIDCRLGGVDDPRLYICIDHKKVLQIKHLKWKFRGNERIQVDGIPIQVSWDVYNWLFQKHDDVEADGYALFIFKFEKEKPPLGFEDEEEEPNLMSSWSHRHHQHHQQTTTCGFGFETKKMKKGLTTMLRSGIISTYSSSSLSLSSLSSSASSGCSSVMEWASVEENELKEPSGFSLLVYAWKS